MLIIPASEEVETGRVWLKTSGAGGLIRPYFKEQADCGGVCCNPSYPRGISRRIIV
jgi:hypothetical protein